MQKRLCFEINFSHEKEKKETLTLNNCHSIMSSMDIASQTINIPTKRANLIAIFIETEQFSDSWRSTGVNPNLMETNTNSRSGVQMNYFSKM